jgi:hypothetical protein
MAASWLAKSTSAAPSKSTIRSGFPSVPCWPGPLRPTASMNVRALDAAVWRLDLCLDRAPHFAGRLQLECLPPLSSFKAHPQKRHKRPKSVFHKKHHELSQLRRQGRNCLFCKLSHPWSPITRGDCSQGEAKGYDRAAARPERRRHAQKRSAARSASEFRCLCHSR